MSRTLSRNLAKTPPGSRRAPSTTNLTIGLRRSKPEKPRAEPRQSDFSSCQASPSDWLQNVIGNPEGSTASIGHRLTPWLRHQLCQSAAHRITRLSPPPLCELRSP